MIPASRINPVWLFLGATSCGRLVEVQVFVHVPQVVQEEFFEDNELWRPRLEPDDYKGRVVVSIDQRNLRRTVSLDVLCGSRDDDLALSYKTAAMGCAEAGRIRAWLEPIDKPGDAFCAPGEEVLSDTAREPDEAWPRAADRVLEEIEEDEACSTISEGVVLQISSPLPLTLPATDTATDTGSAP